MRKESFIRTIMLACALTFACFAQAQTQGASVSGRVTDPKGAAVQGASVTLYARARTQLRLSTTTDAAGTYSFERLAPGEYLIEADANGFARSAAREVTVAHGGTASLDVQLEVAGVSRRGTTARRRSRSSDAANWMIATSRQSRKPCEPCPAFACSNSAAPARSPRSRRVD